MKLLGLSGSLRAESSNSRLLACVAGCVPAGTEFHATTCIGELPHFSPDLDPASIAVVNAWVDEVRSADGLIVSTPEYARGYPGSLKNALDWLVQTDAHIDKPFMLLNASGRSRVGQTTLTTVLETMSGIHIKEATTTIALLGKSLTTAEILKEPDLKAEIVRAVEAFVEGINALGK